MMRGFLIACATICILPTLCSCRAFESSPCSAPEVTATVKSLVSGENSNNPAAALLAAMAKATFSIDAIRTASSSTNQTTCEARLTIKTELPQHKLDANGLYTPPRTTEAQATEDKISEQLATKTEEIAYRVENTDDGQYYITIIPSQAEIIDQENRRQQYRQQEFEQEQQARAQQQRDIERQEEYERDLQESWRR